MNQVADFEIAPDNIEQPPQQVVAGLRPSRKKRVVRARVYLKSRVFECEVRLIPEVSGFSAYVRDLPGVVSQGENVEEAVRMIEEALVGALRGYLEAGSIPWTESEETPPSGEQRRWVVVHV
ncbi:MAG: type II toxin-antitoxin system HicB family antitoxin [Planctomycetota bacterium]